MALLSRLRAAAHPYTIRSSRRSYGSAATQLDYDYGDDYKYYEETRVRPVVMEESEGSVPRRGVQWVIMGDHGRSYGSETRVHPMAFELLDVPYISMGSLVLQELHPRSSLYKQIVEAVNQGKLIPEDVIFGLLSKRLEEGYCMGESGFISDGIPRSKIQAEILDKIVDIDLFLNLKCAEGEMSMKDNKY